MSIPAWVSQLTSFQTNRAANRSLTRNMALLLANRDFETLNTILGSVDWPKHGDVVIMGFIRLSAVAKDFCPNWSSARDAVYAELQARHLDADAIMMGLLS